MSPENSDRRPALEDRLRFETLLADLSSRFINLPAGEVDREIIDATTVVPQMRLLGSVVGLAGDTATTVGSATVEIEVLDPVTNERLAAAVDARAGTKVLFAKRAYQTWGDVAAACEYWSKRIAWQLARHGVQRKAGVAMPEEPSESRSF